MPYTQSEILEHSKRIRRSPRCLRYWIAEGCDLKNAASVEAFLQAKELRKTNVQKVRERRGGSTQAARAQGQCAPQTRFQPVGNGDLPPAGKRGAAAALERLEHQEEESYRRLQAALARGNTVEVQAAQKFWLRCSETLRRLDLAVEIARRQEENQIPLRTAEDAITAATECA